VFRVEREQHLSRLKNEKDIIAVIRSAIDAGITFRDNKPVRHKV
jgi:hypothetical protein